MVNATVIYVCVKVRKVKEKCGHFHHHPINSFRNLWNFASVIDFVKISASWSSVLIHLMVMSLPICDKKWWYFSAMCFVRGLILGDFTRSTQPLLSSKNVECSSPVTAASSSNKFFIGMRSRMAWDNAMYSASVVDKAISVCSFDAQITGHHILFLISLL
jgi:hypothetical protein